MSSVFTAAATGAGFLFTAASILMAMADKQVIKWGRETGAYEMFTGYIVRGVLWSALAAIVSLSLFVPDFTRPEPWHSLALAVWAGSVGGMAASLLRVFIILAEILKTASREDDESSR